MSVQGSAKLSWLAVGCLFGFELAKESLTFLLGPVPICMDPLQYYDFGKSVASGDLLLFEHEVSYRVPGYGWFLGVFLALFGRYALVAAIAAQHVLVISTSLVPALLCFRMTGRPSAFLAAYAISVFSVSRAWFANVLLADTLFTFCLALLWWAWYEAIRSATIWSSLRLGVALSLALLVRPVPQLLWMPIFLTLIIAAYGQRPRLRLPTLLARLAIILCVMAVFVSPWVIRNRLMFGDAFLAKLPAVNKWLVCFQAGSSANLPLPNDEATRRLIAIFKSCGHDPNDRYCYHVIGALERHGLSEREIDKLVNKVCLAAIAEHPYRFAYSAFKRSLNIWRCQRNVHPAFGAGQPSNFGSQFTWRSETVAKVLDPVLRNALSRSVRCNELVLLTVALGCCWLMRDAKTRIFGIALTLAFLYFSAITGIVETENYRYRMILEPAMIVAVVAGAYTRFAPVPPASAPALHRPAH